MIGDNPLFLLQLPEAIWRTERKEELGFDGALRRQRRLSASLRIFEDMASISRRRYCGKTLEKLTKTSSANAF